MAKVVSLREQLAALRDRWVWLANDWRGVGDASHASGFDVCVSELDALLALETPEPTCGTCRFHGLTLVCQRGVSVAYGAPANMPMHPPEDFGCNQWAARATAEQE